VLRHPQAVRPWQHVLDCLGGYVTLAEALASDPKGFSGEWNFGPSDSETCSVSRIVESLATHWSVQPPWVQDGASHSPEEQELRLDVNKAANLLGWRCRLTLDNALQWVATWYREYHNGRDARSLCREQIDSYLNLESR
jgi:CDP-glucose 4,6-dehydratase